MPKRFTEADKWRDRWFRQLPPCHKLAWVWLCDNCDHAGVVDLDEELAEFQIGCKVDWPTFLSSCDDRVEQLSGGKFWLSRFIEFQYGEISERCPAHKPVIASLKKHNLTKGIKRLQDKDKNKDKDKAKDKDGTASETADGTANGTAVATQGATRKATREGYPEEFEAFWLAYPPRKGRRRGKQESFVVWKKIPDGDRAKVVKAAEHYAREETEYIRDAVRFLKDDWWSTWVEAPTTKPKRKKTREELLSAALVWAKKNVPYEKWRNWNDDTCIQEYERCMTS